MRYLLSLTAGALALTLAQFSGAASLLAISGGTTGLGFPPPGNDVIGGPLDPGITDTGGVGLTSGANLLATAGAVLTYDYIGAEAGYSNIMGAPVSTTIFTNTGFIDQSDVTTAPEVGGTVSFEFDTQTTPGSVTNGFNANPSTNTPNFLMAYLDMALNISATATNRVLILFDDAAPPVRRTDDHDDMGVIVSAVPIPAAVWLLGSGVIGLVFVGRLKRI